MSLNASKAKFMILSNMTATHISQTIDGKNSINEEDAFRQRGVCIKARLALNIKYFSHIFSVVYFYCYV